MKKKKMKNTNKYSAKKKLIYISIIIATILVTITFLWSPAPICPHCVRMSTNIGSENMQDAFPNLNNKLEKLRYGQYTEPAKHAKIKAGIKKTAVSIEDRIKILPESKDHKSTIDFYKGMNQSFIEKLKNPTLEKVAAKKSFKKWKKYEDKYISFIYPDHPNIVLKINDSESIDFMTYRLLIGKQTYCEFRLNEIDSFEDDMCLCGAIAFDKYLFANGTLLRFGLLNNGYVKNVQALSDKYKVDMNLWTHLPIPQAPYIKIASSIRFKEPANAKKLKEKIIKKYHEIGFLEKGLNRRQVIKLLGKPSREKSSKLIYDYPERSYLYRYTIEFNKNGKFEGLKKGWRKKIRLKPKHGSIDWIYEKVDKYSFEQNNTEKENYYKSYYPGMVITYNLTPLTVKDIKMIFNRFLELAPKVNNHDWYTLCDAIDQLAEHGYMNDKILPVFIARYSKEIMPHTANKIIQRYRPKNRNQLLIGQIKLIYDYARKEEEYNEKYFNIDLSAIDILLIYAPKKAQELILTGMRHPNSEIRDKAYRLWDELPKDKVIQLLRKGLKEKDSDIRSECADAFKSIGTKQDLKLLKDALKNEKEGYIKENLKSAIKRISEGKKGTKVMFGND